MKRLAFSLAVFSFVASPVPLHARPSGSPAAEEALECAVWASYFSVAFEGEDEEAALSNALNYFVGRYEGLSGQGLDETIDEEVIVDAASDLDALTPVCTARMAEYGGRMLEWSKELEAIGKRLPGAPVQ